MRPRRLELKGFAVFREAQVVDFDDAGYFALIGPTGSGKSTIIDAICFALYGSVSRYGHQGLVAPVISQGGIEARVRFDFSIDDTPYSAVRVVRRGRRGATTREARLERDGEVLAGNADELSREVERLLGLPFDHFTRCVVLPQGEFARFLHDKPKDRQDLLVKLLHLGVYDWMGGRARDLAAEAKNRGSLIEERLGGELAFATPEALAEARRHTARLETLSRTVRAARPRLDELRRQSEGAEQAATRSLELEAALAAVSIPGEVAEVADRMAHASKLADEATETLTRAERRSAAAEAEWSALPERDPLAEALRAHKEKERLAGAAAPQRTAAVAAHSAEDEARDALRAADEALQVAARERDEGVGADAAHHLAGALVAGELCPVCKQRVDDLPANDQAPDLAAKRAAEAEALAALQDAQRRLAHASDVRSAAGARLETLEMQIAALDEQLDPQSDRAEVEDSLKAIDAAQKAVEAARASETEARAAHQSAVSGLNDLKAAEAEARQSFERARDALIPLGPPLAARLDLAADWEALAIWARSRRKTMADEALESRRRAQALETERAALVDELAAACRDCGIELPSDQDMESAVVAALTRAQGVVERIEEGLASVAAARAELEDATHKRAVARELGTHLQAQGFERWIVNEALQRLVDGAGAILRQLSGGAYSLAIDDTNNFQVIDHHDADEVRSARTLSGGETFLASLALALALADQLAQLAAEGAARLDAIFLDEGFGTLDPDTLDTVAATVENLAATGRMVGVVTHVRELAERVPVQFRVTKDGRSARVERVTV